MTVSLARQTGACGHCGRPDVGSQAAGYGGVNGTVVCHPNVDGRPDCYKLVTLFRHPMDCRCEERTNPIAGDRSRKIWS